MPDIYTILDNISEYRDDIDNLVRQLKALGINSVDELKKVAKESRTAIPASIQSDLADKFANSDEDDWNEAKTEDTEEAYMHYLATHPDGSFRDGARNSISRLQEMAESKAEDDEWKIVAEEGNVDDIRGFLIKHPDSRFKEDAEELLWNCVDKSDIGDLSRFIKSCPDNDNVQEAKRLISELRKERYLGVGVKGLIAQIKNIQTDKKIIEPEKAIYEKIVSYLTSGKITLEDFLMALKEDHNFISGTVARSLWDNGYVSDTDFIATEIDPDFITCMMSNITSTPLPPSEKLDHITMKDCTEIYFWGIPSSGKSCAIGAILSVANSGRVALCMEKNNECQGYGYMTRLANIFKSNGSVGALPEGTSVTSTYEMGFNLEDQDKKVHPITCIDLAGELVRCMYKADAKENLSDEQKSVLDMLTSIMIDKRTKNRKIHFFVIEYGAEDRQYEGLPQQDYLQAAVAYIQRTGIFAKDTDGLYLLVTKVDKAKAHGRELSEKLKEYISVNYQGFYNGLKKICRDNEINGGEVEIIPFSLGEVCFQNYCKFNDKAAVNVVNKILNRSYGYKPDKLHIFLGNLTK